MRMIFTNVRIVGFQRQFFVIKYHIFLIKNLIFEVWFSNKKQNDYKFCNKIQRW
jgi:hypothetical protein